MLRLQDLLLLAPIAVCIFIWGFLISHDGAHLRSKLPVQGSFGQLFEPRLGGIEIRLRTLEQLVRTDKEMLEELDAMKTRLDELPRPKVAPQAEAIVDSSAESNRSSSTDESIRKGLLQCEGAPLDSEVVYWKVVPGDLEYER